MEDPGSIHCTIAWEFIINHRIKARETEADLTIAPHESEDKTLKANRETY